MTTTILAGAVMALAAGLTLVLVLATKARRRQRLLAEERVRTAQLLEQLAALKADAIRVHGRNKLLTELLAADGDTLRTEYIASLERRMAVLQRGCARYLAALWLSRRVLLRSNLADVRHV